MLKHLIVVVLPQQKHMEYRQKNVFICPKVTFLYIKFLNSSPTRSYSCMCIDPSHRFKRGRFHRSKVKMPDNYIQIEIYKYFCSKFCTKYIGKRVLKRALNEHQEIDTTLFCQRITKITISMTYELLKFILYSHATSKWKPGRNGILSFLSR